MDPEGLNSFQELAQEATNRGRAVVYTTQLSDLALKFSNRILVLHEGKFRFEGSPESLQSEFDNDDFLAKFRNSN